MTAPARVALLDHRLSASTKELAQALAGAGARPTVLTAQDLEVDLNAVPTTHLRSLPEAPLRARKIGDGLAHLPAALRSLGAGHFEVAHALTPTDALAATAWARRTARPAVFTCVDTPRREDLAARRLRLATWQRAVEASDAVIAPDDEVARALRRWLAVDASVLAARDGEGHLAMYEHLSVAERHG